MLMTVLENTKVIGSIEIQSASISKHHKVMASLET